MWEHRRLTTLETSTTGYRDSFSFLFIRREKIKLYFKNTVPSINRLLTVGDCGRDSQTSEEQLGRTSQELEPYVWQNRKKLLSPGRKYIVLPRRRHFREIAQYRTEGLLFGQSVSCPHHMKGNAWRDQATSPPNNVLLRKLSRNLKSLREIKEFSRKESVNFDQWIFNSHSRRWM
jgi:hypothetical protein